MQQQVNLCRAAVSPPHLLNAFWGTRTALGPKTRLYPAPNQPPPLRNCGAGLTTCRSAGVTHTTDEGDAKRVKAEGWEVPWVRAGQLDVGRSQLHRLRLRALETATALCGPSDEPSTGEGLPVQWADVCDAILSTCAPGDEATAAATLTHVVLTGGLWSSLLRSAAAAVAMTAKEEEEEKAEEEAEMEGETNNERASGGGRGASDAVASLQDGDVQQMTAALWLSFCTTWALPGTAEAAAGAAAAATHHHDSKKDANGGGGPVVGSRLPAPVGWMLRATRAGTCFAFSRPEVQVGPREGFGMDETKCT